jgi:hypothetical protein
MMEKLQVHDADHLLPSLHGMHEKLQVHDADHLLPSLHGMHENSFHFTCVKAAYSVLYWKFHVHFINPQNVYYTFINIFIKRNSANNSLYFFLWCLFNKMNRKIIFVCEAADKYI